MQVPWIDSVKSAGYLTVYNGIDKGKWSGVFKYLLHNFSALTNKKIDLKAETDMNAANVVMQISDCVGTFTYDGTPGKACIFSDGRTWQDAAVPARGPDGEGRGLFAKRSVLRQ